MAYGELGETHTDEHETYRTEKLNHHVPNFEGRRDNRDSVETFAAGSARQRIRDPVPAIVRRRLVASR
ncbi:hypothetical protein EVAR_57152_1 [Eumeta japonica]|uniref:Uncharacterized protein n=1 Tax=Eumeta variegata TaxID=151549 RepID=A0A4C1YUR6_EUMVA|nr:hypothetical protein EVAR_57152_1 [Eumeta japonica]